MFEKKIDTQQAVDRLIASRWSGRAFDSKRSVKHADIFSLLEAVRWSPSCFGEQPWRYIVCDKTRNQSAWDKAYSCLAEGNQLWAVDAPLLIMALAKTMFSHNHQHNRWAEYDTGAGSMSLCIQATALGLMVHQMGGFSPNKVVELFAVPEQYNCMSVLAVGYQLPKDDISAELMERESAPRQRNPLAELFFDGKWGAPIA